MSETTINLNLPYIMPSQAQKHVTHNEALTMLDAIVQLGVLDRNLSAPPGDPGEGDRYIVGTDATAEWEGWDGSVAFYVDGAWLRIEPKPGWVAWVADEEVLVRWTGTGWSEVGGATAAVQNLPFLGVRTTADEVNPFAAKLNTALWSAMYDEEGGDGSLRLTFNKEATADVLSLILQSDWSARAEIGLVGVDDLTLKVSSDGESWREGMRIERDTGRARFAHTPALDALSGMQAILGTVSQSGGVPTGALAETGSNANGSYFRFAGGLQVCMHEVTLTYLTPVLLNGVWTFPAEFAAKPVVTHTIDVTSSVGYAAGSSTERGRWGMSGVWPSGNGLSAFGIQQARVDGAPDFSPGNTVRSLVVAVGRWHA